jgi:hypothetical protein
VTYTAGPAPENFPRLVYMNSGPHGTLSYRLPHSMTRDFTLITSRSTHVYTSLDRWWWLCESTSVQILWGQEAANAIQVG